MKIKDPPSTDWRLPERDGPHNRRRSLSPGRIRCGAEDPPPTRPRASRPTSPRRAASRARPITATICSPGHVCGGHEAGQTARRDARGLRAPEDVRAYRRDGKFPDGATLVKDVTPSVRRNSPRGSPTWAKDIKISFVMVKDSKGRFSGNDLWGDGWGWASSRRRPSNVATDYTTDCRTCHIPAKKDDWVYVRGYPALAKAAPAK